MMILSSTCSFLTNGSDGWTRTSNPRVNGAVHDHYATPELFHAITFIPYSYSFSLTDRRSPPPVADTEQPPTQPLTGFADLFDTDDG